MKQRLEWKWVALALVAAATARADESVAPAADTAPIEQTQTEAPLGVAVPPASEHNRTFAAYDRRCDAMRTSVAPIDPIDHEEEADYFEAPIPHQVHQIWFGDANALDDTKPALWRQMAAQFQYDYRLWTEADVEELRAMMPARNAQLLDAFLENGSYHSASDIARISILEALGGLYIDCDMRPPRHKGELIDPARVFPMRNLVLMSEVNARDVGARISLFVANGFVLSSPKHPLLQHLVASIPRNVEAMVRHGAADNEGRGPAEFMTGPFVWTRSLAGAVTIVPITYLKKLGVL